MQLLFDFLFQPFIEFGFMRRALVACLALSISAGPIGVFLVLRRMALMGDAMSHAILPGAAIGFLVAGLSLWAMSLGGLIVALIVALAAGVMSRITPLKEDAALAGFFLISLALGVLLVSVKGSSVDLLHILFGTLLAVSNSALVLIAGASTITVLVLALIYRTLILECFDPGFLRAVGGRGGLAHATFLALVVLNMVAAMQALGTLMAIGLMMLPATSARLWTISIGRMIGVAVLVAVLSSVAGLIFSYYANLPSGPAVILSAGLLYLLSLAVGSNGGLLRRYIRRPHLEH
ncbi:metal ABC transporter permease [Dongia deserti]|uniref:metal ABC transporter permease n=1 Tax=Dongia deserti TaxID=2268030 RepID=UPI000E653C56|nr:metal ABC transporter permease [Dongia deserti]